MDAANKYVSSEGLQYFHGLVNGTTVRKDQELLDPDFANENNIIILWDTGSNIKCVAPVNVDYSTKLVYLGTGSSIYYDAPEEINTNSGNTGQTVVFGTNSEYTLYRGRSSSSESWKNTFDRLNGTALWDETGKRTQYQTGWIRTGTTAGVDLTGCTGGSLSPISNTIGSWKPIYGYD